MLNTEACDKETPTLESKMTENEALELYYEMLAQHFTDNYTSKLFPVNSGVKITSTIGKIYGENWRHGESEIHSSNPYKMKKIVLKRINEFREDSGGKNGILHTDLEKLNELCDVFSHVFLTGPESEHLEWVEMLTVGCETKLEQVEIITHCLNTRNKPPIVPVINVDTFFTCFAQLVGLIVLRDIANEALNEGTDGDDSEEKLAFIELRTVLYSIADAHKCSCGARAKAKKEAQETEGEEEDDEDEKKWENLVGSPAGCKCDRGGGFNMDIICTAIADFLGETNEENTPISAATIADEIFGNEMSEDDEEEDDEIFEDE